MEIVLLIRIECRRCAQIFNVCRSCWRGQAYCCQKCRLTAQKEAHRKAQKKYRQTLKGKETHRLQERNRRLRQSKKNMDDATTNPDTIHDNVLSKPADTGSYCHFCGKIGHIVDVFPWREYAGRTVRTDLIL